MKYFSKLLLNRWNASIRTRLTTLFSILIGLISLFIFVFFPARLQEQAIQSIGSKAEGMAEMIAFSISPALYFEDIDAAEEALRGARQNKDLEYIVVVDHSKRIFTAVYQDNATQANFLLAEKGDRISQDSRVYMTMTPILNNGSQIGRLYLGLSLRELRTEIKKSRTTVALVSCIVFVIGMMAVVGISTLVTGPLSHMVETVERIAGGDLTQRAVVTSNDEVGHLARSFNLMVANLESAYSELENVNRNLEQRVEERTHELQQEIAERKRAEEALRKSEERYRRLVELSPDAIAVHSDERLAYVNRAGARLLRADDPQRVIGRPTLEFVQADHRQKFSERIRRVREEGTEVPFAEETFVRLDGTTVDVEVAAISLSYQDRPAVQLVIRDITERKRAERELRNALEKEKELGQLKSRFVSMASHEFRTPLTTIQAASDLLKRYSDRMTPEEKLERLEKIQTEVKHMTQLLNDVLTYGKADAGRIEFNPVPLDLETFCKEIAEEIEISDGTRHTIAFSRTGEFTHAVMDKKLLRQILTNLLTNAVKYSPDGSTVHFDLACENGEVVFRVKDEGIGIPESDQKRLFEPFHRAANVGNISGTGLGLAIAKKSVDLHGGAIHFQSKDGAGTTFIVRIPRTPSKET